MSLPCEKFRLRIAVPPGIWDVTAATVEWNSTNPCEFCIAPRPLPHVKPRVAQSASLCLREGAEEQHKCHRFTGKDTYPGDFHKCRNQKSLSVCQKIKKCQRQRFGPSRIFSTITRAMWIVRFAGTHQSQSDALSNVKEINERRERSPLRRWVLIQELPGIRMGRGRVRGRVGG